MLEKYLKIIKDSQDKKKYIQDFFASLNMSTDEVDFDVEKDILKIKVSSANRFILKLNENKIKDFCEKNKLIYKTF